MSDNKFDLEKLKGNVGDLVGNLKSMLNPGGNIPNVDPDDALGLKVAKIATLIKQMTEAQHEHVKNLAACNELLVSAFQDIEALRNSVKAEKAGVQSQAAPAAETKPVDVKAAEAQEQSVVQSQDDQEKKSD